MLEEQRGRNKDVKVAVGELHQSLEHTEDINSKLSEDILDLQTR